MVRNTSFFDLSVAEQLKRIEQVARKAMPLWRLPAGSAIKLLNHSENTTYRIDPPGARAVVMRVHRTGYHTTNGIRSELLWMKALNESGIHTPQAIPTAEGEMVAMVDAPGLDDARHVVLFDWVDGEAPDPMQLIEPFARLGEISARMHRHVLGWQRPDWFERLVWDEERSIGRNVNWGHWEEAPAMTPERLELLSELASVLRARLAAFGKAPERYNLVHADMRLANLLIADGDPRVIDFDDCGFSWFLYDFGTATTFIEDYPEVPDLIASWVAGYRKVRPLGDEEVAEIPTFMMLRRLVIAGWIASHPGTDLALELGEESTAGTCLLAQTYLDSPAIFFDRKAWPKRPHQPASRRIIRN